MNKKVTPKVKDTNRKEKEDRKKDLFQGRRSNQNKDDETGSHWTWDEDLSAGPKE